MKLSPWIVFLVAIVISGCKPRQEAESSLRDAQLSKLSSRASCVVYQKDDIIFAAKCPKQSELITVNSKPDNVTDEQWKVLKDAKTLTRLQCSGGNANELAKMSANEYEKQLSESLSITEMPIVLSNLLAKKALLVEIEENLETVRKIQSQDTSTSYTTEANAIAEQKAAVQLQIEEYESYLTAKDGSVKQAKKIMDVLQPQNNEVFYYPNNMVEAILSPLLGKDIDQCFEAGTANTPVQQGPAPVSKPSQTAPVIQGCMPVAGHGYAPRGPAGPIYDNSYADIFESDSDCMRAVAGQKNNLICSAARTHWAIFRISDGKRLSGNASGIGERNLTDCINTITNYSNETYVCGRSGLNRYVFAISIKDGARVEEFADDTAWANCKVYVVSRGTENLAGIPPTNGNNPTSTNPVTTNPVPTKPVPTKPVTPTPVPGTGKVSANPESLPMDSPLASSEVAKAMKEIDSAFNVDPGTKKSCLGVTPPTWSDVMAHYYCQFPIVIGNNDYSVRACFTGSVRGQAPYAKIDDYRNAYDFCIGRKEFQWVNQSAARKAMFQYIMLSQRQLQPGEWRFSKSSQDSALVTFYGGAVPARK